MRSITALRSDPPASSQEAWAWRRSWTRTWKSTPDEATAGRQMRVRKVFLEKGVLRGEGVQDGVGLVGGEGAGCLLDLLRELGVGAGVEGDDPVDQGALEHRVQHGVVFADGRGGEAVVGGGGDPALHFGGED